MSHDRKSAGGRSVSGHAEQTETARPVESTGREPYPFPTSADLRAVKAVRSAAAPVGLSEAQQTDPDTFARNELRLQLCQAALASLACIAADSIDLIRHGADPDESRTLRVVERLIAQMGSEADAALSQSGRPSMYGDAGYWALSPAAADISEQLRGEA